MHPCINAFNYNLLVSRHNLVNPIEVIHRADLVGGHLGSRKSMKCAFGVIPLHSRSRCVASVEDAVWLAEAQNLSHSAGSKVLDFVWMAGGYECSVMGKFIAQ